MQLIQPKAMKWTTTTLPFRPFIVSGLLLTQAAMSSNSGAACRPLISTGVQLLGSSLSLPSGKDATIPGIATSSPMIPKETETLAFITNSQCSQPRDRSLIALIAFQLLVAAHLVAAHLVGAHLG